MQRLQNMPRFLARCAGVSLLLFCSLPATAALPRKAIQQDIYPATESDAATAAPATPKLTSVTITKKAQAAGSRPALPAPSASRPLLKMPDSALAYDVVPSDQVDPISKRLRLVDTLIRRHARAYDYRTHTVADLETILVKLDAIETSAVPHKQAAAQADVVTGDSEIPVSSED